MNDEELKKSIPPLEVVKEAISQFHEIDWSKINGGMVEIAIGKVLQNMLPQIFYSPPINCLYRARSFNSFNGQLDISNPKNFYYPPSDLCSVGRANLEYQQVFYGSLSKNTTIYEIGEEDESLYFISKWKVKSLKDKAGVLFYSNLKKQFNYPTIREQFKDRGLSENNFLAMEELANFYQIQFSKVVDERNPNDYKFTSYIANKYLNKFILDIGYICYPSIRQERDAFNFAFKKSFADQMLELEKVYLVDTQLDESNSIDFTVLKFGINNPDINIIKWSNMNDEEFEIEWKK